MQVTRENAAVIVALFSKLSDERFTMRTPAAIMKDTQVTEAQLLDVSAQIGLEFKRRIRDNALLIERPTSVNAAQAQEIAQKAAALLAEGSTAEPFDLQFADVMGEVEASPSVSPLDGDDEDRQFH